MYEGFSSSKQGQLAQLDFHVKLFLKQFLYLDRANITLGARPESGLWISLISFVHMLLKTSVLIFVPLGLSQAL